MIWMRLLLCCLFVWLKPGESSYFHEMSATWITTNTISPNASFGYSISYEPTSKHLITSAPQDNRTGEIYACDLSSITCERMPKNSIIDNTIDGYQRVPNWFGAVVKAGPSYVVTCAPLSIVSQPNSSYSSTIYRPGTFAYCFKYTNPMELPITLTSLPMSERDIGTILFEQRMDSFGWSIDTVDDDIIIGSPAMFTGRAIKYHDVEKAPISLTGFQGRKLRVDHNFGYSVVAWRSAKTRTSYAVGSPYGLIGKGLVAFYSRYSVQKGMHPSGVLENTDEFGVGSMFGAVLCVASLETTVLLVGAPTYAPEKHRVDVGAVYLYPADKTPRPEQLMKKIVGHQDSSYFGSAIVSVGDLNGDEMDEIAIGAPYENSGSGAVYLYSSAEIISKKKQIGYIQKILPEPNQARAFGLSMTMVQDYDENGCNELAIGAPESNKVKLLRCIASVRVQVEQSIAEPKIGEPRNSTHLVIQSCLKLQAPEKPKEILAHFQVNVQISHPKAKLANPEDKEYRIVMDSKNRTDCRPIVIETPKGANYGIPIRSNITATQLEHPELRKEFEARRVALSDLSVLTSARQTWLTDCNKRDNCMPDLTYVSAELSVASPHVIGSQKTIDIDVTIRNDGETAYDPCLRIAAKGFTAAQVPPDCERINDELKCAPKVNLRNESFWNTKKIPFEVTHLTNLYKNITFTIKVFNHCEKNEFKLYTEVITLTTDSSGIFIKGVTDFGLDDKVNLTKTEAATGKAFEHSYTISNSGPTNWVGVSAKLVIQKRDFIVNETIILSTEDAGRGSQQCEFISETVKDATYVCYIDKLYKNVGFSKITIPMFIKPGVLETVIDENKNTVLSQLYINYDGIEKYSSVLSHLRISGVSVPIWIIIAAALLGLVILFIIFFILRECGFFQREKKEELKKVQRNVKRQTIMRRSMMEGGRLQPGTDRVSLIDAAAGEPITADEAVNGDHRLRLGTATRM